MNKSNPSAFLEESNNTNIHSDHLPHSKFQNKKESVLESIPIYIAVQAFFHGLFTLNTLTIFFYQKEVLNLEPAQIQFISGIMALPYCLKPIFGYLIDRFITFYGSSNALFIASGFLQAIIMSLFAHMEFKKNVFFTLYFIFMCCSVVQNIISEYILCVYTQKQTKLTGKSKNEYPIFFGFKAAGNLIGTFFGGRLIKYGSMSTVFYICSFIPVFIMAVSLLHKEETHTESTIRSITEEFDIIWKLLSQQELALLIFSLALINICPNFDSMTNYFLLEELKFTSEDLADLGSASTIAYIIGLIFYYKFLVDYSPRKLFLGSNILLLFGSITFLSIVLNILQKFGINVKFFCMLNSSFYSFIAELNAMPVLTIWTSYTPPGLEATSITLFTGISNLTSNISNYTGSFVLYICGIQSKELKKVWVPLVIQNIYLIVITIVLFFIPFSDSPKEKELVALENNDKITNSGSYQTVCS